MQPRSDSRIAYSLASRLEQLVRHLSREHLTVGIILLVLGVFAFQISPWLAWFTIGSGLLLLTWHARIRNTYRGLLYFLALLPVLHWFNSINEFLFHEDAVTGMMLAQVFARAREQSPSILFIDEIDGLLPRGDNGYFMGQHQIQLVEQALMLMSQLDPGNQVFLVGTTNHIDHIDLRVLRGGRFTEKIEVGIPDDQGYLRLIERYLGPIPLAGGLTCNDLLARLRGISPADLQGLVNTAKRMAMNRMTANDEALPPLIWGDLAASAGELAGVPGNHAARARRHAASSPRPHSCREHFASRRYCPRCREGAGRILRRHGSHRAGCFRGAAA